MRPTLLAFDIARKSSALARSLVLAGAFALGLAPPAPAQWDPGAGQWGKVDPLDLRVMTWNVRDALCSTNAKVEGANDWTACARIVAALRPDVLVLQECGDNAGNGTGNGVDSTGTLVTVMQLFFDGGNDPFQGGTVSAYVRKYAPSYDLPFVFVSSATDGFNRNVVLSRFPLTDLNGDGQSAWSDIPTVLPDAYAPGGDGGIRGFQFVEYDLPDADYPGDLVIGCAHLKAGSGGSDHNQRVDAARNVAYLVDYLLNGAGTGVPDPNGKILDSPPVTQLLSPATPVVLAGDWNEDEFSNGTKGPAEWLTRAQVTGGTDGTDRDRSDMTFDLAADPFGGGTDTIGSAKFDYVAWQDSIATLRIQFLFDSQNVPFNSLPIEVTGFPNPSLASSVASDHLPVVVDLELPHGACPAPQSYCVAAQNSTGLSAFIGWAGSTSLAANDLVLDVQGGVPGQFGLFYYGPAQIQVPFGDGFRCVGSGGVGIFRLNPPAQMGFFGDVVRPLDYTQPPLASGPGQVTVGSRWFLQFWYRDPAAGLSGFNFSDGLDVTFCP